MTSLSNKLPNLLNTRSPIGGEDDFDSMFQRLGRVETLALLAAKCAAKKKWLAEWAMGSSTLAFDQSRSIKTIGVYYPRLRNGGVERKLSFLMPQWEVLGYRVVFFSNEPPTSDDYSIPPTIKRVVLPYSKALDQYKARAVCFEQALKAEQIDLFCYFNAYASNLIFDTLLVKSAGIPFVVGNCGLFSQAMVRLEIYNISQIVPIYRLADSMVVLNDTEKLYWSTLGIPAVCIPNPPLLDWQNIAPSPLDEDHILWLGRLDPLQKRYLDAVKIMAEVIKKIPKARMSIVGDADASTQKELEHEIKRLKLENHVTLFGFRKDVEFFYQKASLFLCTSVYESFCNTIAESKCFGLPCVTYDMPYLELLKDHKGYIAVPPCDISAAAQAIVLLLKDEKLKRQMGKSARLSIEEFSQQDVIVLWDRLFQSLPLKQETSANHEQQAYRIIFDTILFHFSLGCEFHYRQRSETNALRQNNMTVQRKLGQLTAEYEQLNSEYTAIVSSNTYLTGKIVLWMPRKVRGGIRCLKENGLKYTIRHFFEKIVTK